MTLNDIIAALRMQQEIHATEEVRFRCYILLVNMRLWRKQPSEPLRQQIRKNVESCEKFIGK